MIDIVKRLVNSTLFSWAGLTILFHKEFAFRLEIVLTLLLVPVIYWLELEFHIKLLLFALLWLLLIVETINSAIEATVNRISLEHHPLSKQAKDMGSAAVFLTVILNVSVWVLVIFFA